MVQINRRHNLMLRAVIYQMKRQYGGGPLDIYTFGGSTVDLDTGVKQVTKSLTRVKRVVCLPAKVEQAFVQTISKISADKMFVRGGTYDALRRMFLIDRRDAPDLSLKLDDWLVYDGCKYEVKKFDSFEFSALWVVVASQVIGNLPEQFILASADDILSVSDGATEED